MNSFKYAAPLLLGATLLGGCAADLSATQPGAYAGQQSRAIKSLSDDEITSLLEGRGMGYAKAAELNGYPGPMHVLEHAKGLALSDQQEAATRTLLATHKAQVRELGKELVQSERDLDTLFATRAIEPAALERHLAVIAARRAAVRASHLQTHLTQTALLTSAQIKKYAELRGYGSGDRNESHAHH